MHHPPISRRNRPLDAFAVESDQGSETLVRYLQQYPQYAEELVDLSRELSRTHVSVGYVEREKSHEMLLVREALSSSLSR